MKKCMTVLAVLAAVAVLSFPAHALQLTLDYPFSGAAPSGFPSATITQVDSKSVLISMSSEALSGTEFISEWSFNVDLLNPAALVFKLQSGVAASTAAGANSFKADGDGWYDFVFYYPTANNAEGRFLADLTSVYLVTYENELPVSLFAVQSAPGGGAGTYYSAAHVQATAESSVWLGATKATTVTTPEPDMLLLLGLGLLALAGIAYSRRKRNNV